MVGVVVHLVAVVVVVGVHLVAVVVRVPLVAAVRRQTVVQPPLRRPMAQMAVAAAGGPDRLNLLILNPVGIQNGAGFPSI